MRFAMVFPILSVMFAACGGRVEGQDQGACPADMKSSCSANARCTRDVTACGNTIKATCNCTNGSWECEEPGTFCEPPQPDRCNGPVSPGSACHTKGATCYSNEPLYCTDIPPPCTCDGSAWRCKSFTCPACPSPSTIKDGAVCSETRFDCPSTMVCAGETKPISCSCIGATWHCMPACGG